VPGGVGEPVVRQVAVLDHAPVRRDDQVDAQAPALEHRHRVRCAARHRLVDDDLGDRPARAVASREAMHLGVVEVGDVEAAGRRQHAPGDHEAAVLAGGRHRVPPVPPGTSVTVGTDTSTAAPSVSTPGSTRVAPPAVGWSAATFTSVDGLAPGSLAGSKVSGT